VLWAVDQLREIDDEDSGTEECQKTLSILSTIADSSGVTMASSKVGKEIRILMVDGEEANRRILMKSLKNIHSDMNVVSVDSARVAIYY
jgi:peptide deformylase